MRTIKERNSIYLFTESGGLSRGMEHADENHFINRKAFVNGKKDSSK